MQRVMIFRITLLFILCLLQSTIIKCNECEDILNSFLKNFNPLDPTNPLNSIGLGFENLGDYDGCISTSTNRYILLKIKIGRILKLANDSTYNGVCLPEICTLQENLEELKSKISNALNIKIENIDTIVVENENKKYISFTALKIIILIGLTVYFLFACGLLNCLFNYGSTINKSTRKESNILKKDDISVNDNSIKEKKIVLIKEKNINDYSTDENNGNYSSFDKNQIGENFDESPKKKMKTVVINQGDSSNFTFTEKKVDDNSILNNCFNIKKNISSMFDSSELDFCPELKIFNGVKIFIIIKNVFTTFTIFIQKMPSRNPEIVYDNSRTFVMQLFLNTMFGFDTLFAISGFLLAFTFINTKQGAGGFSFGKIMKMISLKLLKIWPLYVVAFLFYWNFFIYTLDGALSTYKFNQQLDSCENQWPFMLTMISNFTFGLWEPSSPYCMSWIWYLQLDVQYYILGVFLMAVYNKSKRAFWILFSFVYLTFCAVEGWLLLDLNIKVNFYDLETNNDYHKFFLFKLYTRSSPFWIGIFFGIIYAAYKSSLESNKFSRLRNAFDTIQVSSFLSWFFYLFGLGIMISFIFSTYWSYYDEWDLRGCFIYNFVGKKLFTVGFFLFLLPLFLGNLYYFGGWLGSDVLSSFSKLCVPAYLIHPFFIIYFFLNHQSSVYFTGYFYIVMCFSFLGISFLAALAVRLLLEMPFVRMENFLKGKSISCEKNSDDLEDGKERLLNISTK